MLSIEEIVQETKNNFYFPGKKIFFFFQLNIY